MKINQLNGPSTVHENSTWLKVAEQFVSACYLPNHGKRKVVAHKLKLGT